MFEAIEHPQFNRDEVAIRHELGHAVVWVYYGQQIMQLTIQRCKNRNLLWPHISLETKTSDETDAYAESLAERWLAGESAARKHMGWRWDRISTKNFQISSQSNIPAIWPQMDQREDFVRVLGIAHKTANSNWYVWIRQRLHRAHTIVEQNWEAINRVATIIQGRLPVPGEETLITGNELTTLLKEAGAQRAK
jgi:hypothetical protein